MPFAYLLDRCVPIGYLTLSPYITVFLYFDEFLFQSKSQLSAILEGYGFVSSQLLPLIAHREKIGIAKQNRKFTQIKQIKQHWNNLY